MERARAALIMAAMRRSIVTYKELGLAIGISGVDLRNLMPRVLAELAEDCNADNEPVLAALVVNGRTGRPGPGWTDGSVPWHAEVQKVFRRWSS